MTENKHQPKEEDAERLITLHGSTSIWIAESGTITPTGQVNLLEEIISPQNLNKAFKRVRKNKGKHGIDNMPVNQLKEYLV